jgi:fatty acid amide hydrolase
MRGCRNVLLGQEVVRAMAGPIARKVDDLALFFRALDPRMLSALDSRVPPMAWEDAARLEGLRVGVYSDDGVLAASHSVSRAVGRAADVLRARGCVVKTFEPPGVRAVLSTYLGILSADGGAALVAALAGGEVDPVLEPLRRMASVPTSARRVLARAARAVGQRNLGLMLDAIGAKSVSDLWMLTAQLRTQCSSLVDEMKRACVDILLCPPYATAALPHGATKNFTLASSYSILFNAAQLPAGVVPVTRVRADETARAAGRDALERQAAKIDAASVGLPVGVQVVGRAWRDDEVLAAMRAIESDASGDDDYPVTPVETVDRSACTERASALQTRAD